MIFVTVGHQMPFDRLVRAVDVWAERFGRRDAYGQVGSGGYRPRFFESTAFLSPEEFRERVQSCSAIVSHAGMGTILTALEMQRPILLLPRLSALGETRNDHQVGTARHFATASPLVSVASDETLSELLGSIEGRRAEGPSSAAAHPALLARLREFARNAHESRR